MGTSSSYRGPSGRTALLPPWADDDALPAAQPPPSIEPAHDDGDPGVTPTTAIPEVTWRAPKRVMSQLVGAGGGGGGGGASLDAIRTLGRSYTRASGGSQAAASAARAGRATTRRLAAFLAGGIRDGVGSALAHVGLQNLVGRDAQTVLAAFIALLAPDGALLESAAARMALIETLEEVFERYAIGADGVEALERMDVAALGEVIALSVVNYIDARIQQELANRIERGTLPEADANHLMDEIRGFIGEIVKLDFHDRDLVHLDWEGVEGHRLVDGIYEEAYRLLGGEA